MDGGEPGFGDSWQATVSPPSGAGQRRPWSLEADISRVWAEGHARGALQLPTCTGGDLGVWRPQQEAGRSCWNTSLLRPSKATP